MELGLPQLLKKTPAAIRQIRATLIYTIAGTLPFTGTLAAKFGLTPLEYAEWCGLLILGVKAISMLFGVSDEQEVQAAIKTIDKAGMKVEPQQYGNYIGGGTAGTPKPPVNPPNP